MISADVKTNAKQKEMKELVAVFYNFLSDVPSKLEMEYKGASSKGVNNT